MNFLNIGPMELILVLVVALIVFGPKRLPEIGAQVGRGIREFRRAQQQLAQELTRELSAEEANQIKGRPVASRAPAHDGPRGIDRVRPNGLSPDDINHIDAQQPASLLSGTGHSTPTTGERWVSSQMSWEGDAEGAAASDSHSGVAREGHGAS